MCVCVSRSQRVWPLTLAFLQRTLPLSGHVTDTAGRGVAAEIRVDALTDLFVFQSDPVHGFYALFLPDGAVRLGRRRWAGLR